MTNSSPSPLDLDTPHMGTASLPGRAALDIAEVRELSRTSDRWGLLRFGAHMTAMSLTALLVWLATPYWYALWPAMLLHGFTIVTMFAPMHECVHRTAFATRSLNEIFGWIAGVIGFYNFTFYRHFHRRHHRFTQDPDRDPELSTPRPRTVPGYLLEISGFWFWFRRPAQFVKLALGLTWNDPNVPPRARLSIAVSMSAQLIIYALAIASIFWGHLWALYFWFLPAVLAQPLLRLMLIAEHTGCTHDENGLTNTRTTLAGLPVRLLMWNMPFHAEHHLYPSIPFHELPRAHQRLREKLKHVAAGYPAANREVIGSLHLVKYRGMSVHEESR